MNDLKRMQQLISTINEHNHRYYALDDPTISDQEYDSTFKKLLELEKKYPDHISSESPTQRVGTAPIDYLYQVIDKKVGSKLKRRDFNRFAYIIPYERWQTELLPALRRNEINRLQQSV